MWQRQELQKPDNVTNSLTIRTRLGPLEALQTQPNTACKHPQKSTKISEKGSTKLMETMKMLVTVAGLPLSNHFYPRPQRQINVTTH